ncbi:uncharacterized protein JN550_002632 [Neoarthrinium moseri]|uniref:uncharacterized protein n=1 Tax=Neoarthrinium moseri TaxID=1658444 RepID=UPI001FDDA32C|nr:uncharacterized protein JN550_002632 [Neoarthrinium moseri]KAI1874053.1 hypothetical protein JN550_002632 [Neoarthrinium moseri]
MYDNETNKIYYSLCNSVGTPIFPFDDSAALSLPFPPLKGTKITGTGYKNDNGVQAAVFYQEEGGQIVEALYDCDSTGHFVPTPDNAWKISLDIAPSILNGTGLKVFLMGSTDGYRLFYKDEDSYTAELSFRPGDRGWSFTGQVSQTPYLGWAVTGGFIDPNKPIVISAAFLRDDNIELCTQTPGTRWRLETVPDTLMAQSIDADEGASWFKPSNDTNLREDRYGVTPSKTNATIEGLEAKRADIAMSLDSATNPHVFYIGSDGFLHHYQKTWNGTWTQGSTQDISTWPKPDDRNGDIGLDFDAGRDRVWLYMKVNGSLTQLYQSGNNTWEPSFTLLKQNTTDTANSTSPTTEAEPSNSGGLSQGGKIGVGVGVGLGLPLVVAAIAVYMFFHIRNSRKNRDAETAAVQAAHYDATSPAHGMSPNPHLSINSSPAPQYTSGYWEGGYWADGQWVPAVAQPYGKPEGDWRQSQGYYGNNQIAPENAIQPMHELPHQERPQEISIDGQLNEMSAETREPGGVTK